MTCGSRYEMFDKYPDRWPKKYWNENTLDQDTEIYEFNFNLTNFDNIGMAFLTVFQCIT